MLKCLSTFLGKFTSKVVKMKKLKMFSKFDDYKVTRQCNQHMVKHRELMEQTFFCLKTLLQSRLCDTEHFIITLSMLIKNKPILTDPAVRHLSNV